MTIGEIVLGSFLASFLQVLFDKLTCLTLGYVQWERINVALLEEWKEMLVTINAMLADAEDRQLSGNPLVKLWMDDVRDLAYDMEDLLDEFAIKATRVESKAKSNTGRGLEKLNFSFFGRDKSFGSNPNLQSLMSEIKVQEINGRLKAIVTRMAHLSLRENVGDRSNYTNKRDPTTSLSEPQFFGREKEEAQILKLLINEVTNFDATLSIVPIVGMGGVGKTALAQRLYNDARVKSYYEIRAWVCVSDVFDVIDITKTVLRSITGLSYEGEDLNGLQVKLNDNLSRKKFLVVLDDVWNENYGKWTNLLKPFEVGAKGSKIIVTTRNVHVVSIKGASPYLLEQLSLDNCKRLLAFHAFGATNFENHPNLERICKELAKKCKGLPLAAKMLGGALCNERNPDKWEAFLNNKIWDLLKGKQDEVLPILKLSYVHLPSYLKRCFAFCAVFPKDYEIERDELVLLWIAEGFLDGQKAKEDILRLGRDHFDELVSRSFLQQSRIDASKFSMHDLLNDLAKSIEGETCFSSRESQLASNEDDASLEKIRYASFISSWYVTPKCLRPYHKMKVLRSLILVHLRSSGGSLSISNKVLHDLLTNLKYLRVFSLCRCSILEVPNCVGYLKHLRYLNFSYTNIKWLPESISTLCKLQALILRGCQKLSMLPKGITKLVSLQFLDIRNTGSLKEMPLNIGNLKNLTILSKFVVGLDKGSQLKELKNLPHLQGELFISELQKVEDIRDAIDANLIGKRGLTNLFLHWGGNCGNLRNGKSEALVLHSLRPHTNLERLSISYYGGARFPSWLDSPSYSKIVSLCLRDCPNVTLLSSLGQLPSLRELSLEGLHAVRMIGPEFYGGKSPFSFLTTLKFEEMLAWKDWFHYASGREEEEVPFSCLQHLIIRRCHSLVGTLPSQLDLLVKLEIHSCPHLKNSTNVVCLPSLSELYLEDCNNEILKILVNLSSLTVLKIENLAKLVCFDHGFMSCLVKLNELHIGQCDELTYLWQDENEMLNLTCLLKLAIKHCPRFTSFVAEEEEIELPRNLEMMELSHCTSLEKLPSKMHTLKNLSISGCPKLMGVTTDDPNSNYLISQLESLRISTCDTLTSLPFAKGRLAALKTLGIWNCKGVKSLEEFTVEPLNSLDINSCDNLGSLPQYLHMLSHLTRLDISYCPALEIEDFPPLPITLLSLKLWDCPKIKSITGCNITSCSNLTKLEIWECPALEIEDFPPLPVTLSKLLVCECPKIKSISNDWHLFTSLQELMILGCQNIKYFAKAGLPPNLQSLVIERCENLEQPVREWGLPLLTSLTFLKIEGRSMGGEGEKVWFPSDDKDEEDAWSLLFPSSLTGLVISEMRNMEGLSSGLRNHLSSLQSLGIFDCPKLRDLPEDGLPPSLHRLWIDGCEILKDQYSEQTGDIWPLIQEIPSIYIDFVRIQ